jgi:hypothetical protein
LVAGAALRGPPSGGRTPLRRAVPRNCEAARAGGAAKAMSAASGAASGGVRGQHAAPHRWWGDWAVRQAQLAGGSALVATAGAGARRGGGAQPRDRLTLLGICLLRMIIAALSAPPLLRAVSGAMVLGQAHVARPARLGHVPSLSALVAPRRVRRRLFRAVPRPAPSRKQKVKRPSARAGPVAGGAPPRLARGTHQ